MTKSVPGHLVALYTRTTPRPEESRKAEIATSLAKFADVLPDQLMTQGEQNKCQRTINTGDNKPIRQNPVRLPLS